MAGRVVSKPGHEPGPFTKDEQSRPSGYAIRGAGSEQLTAFNCAWAGLAHSRNRQQGPGRLEIEPDVASDGRAPNTESELASRLGFPVGAGADSSFTCFKRPPPPADFPPTAGYAVVSHRVRLEGPTFRSASPSVADIRVSRASGASTPVWPLHPTDASPHALFHIMKIPK
ncbi:hypothetical protein CI238_06686 [Colletotrichum incanum]|uniref:Uncharacterized protein n=1 Tax=Colletotrichum incanum TaxID=1573173 RepID=A0A162N2Z0_COLIC|nr:hypothetical protein CI238_06686 [Colletotrichum incanum]